MGRQTRWTDGWTYRQTDTQADRQADRQTDRQMDQQTRHYRAPHLQLGRSRRPQEHMLRTHFMLLIEKLCQN